MRRAPAFVVAVVLTVVTPSWAEPQSSPTAPRTEQEWIVATIVERLWQLREPIASVPPPPVALGVTTLAASPAVFSVALDGVPQQTLRIETHLWDARNYAGLAAVITGARPLATGGSNPDQDASTALASLDALTAPDLDVLLAEDRRVSAALRGRGASASTHERAALLLGAMVLREGAGVFTDERPALSRMTAHLAVAQVLRGARRPGPAGVVAEAIVHAGVGRERDARAAVEPFHTDGQPAVLSAWARAIDLRVTGNWRALAWPTRATPLERLEYGRALRHRIGDARLLTWLERSGEEPSGRWARIALAFSYSVGAGQWFGELGLAAELAEATQVWREYRNRTGDPDALAAGLAEAGAHSPDRAFRVLDWPLWAGSAERHLAARVESRYRSEWMLGRKEILEALPGRLETAFGRQRLWPAVRLLLDDAGARAAAPAAAELLRTSPDAFAPEAWHAIATRIARSTGAGSARTAAVWFTPWEPSGTVMRPRERSLRDGLRPPPPIPMIERYHQQAPSDPWIAWSLVWWRPPGNPSLVTIRAAYGRLLEYDVTTLRSLFDSVPGTVEELTAIATAMCELDVDQCVRLAEHHRRHGDDLEAAIEFERWFWRASNRVAAANGARWLVHYLLDAHETARATDIAEAAAGIGSATGLDTLAELLERQGRVADAAAIYARMATRYPDSDLPAIALFRRARRAGDTAERDRAVTLLRRRFPRGLEEVPAGQAAPTDGIRFRTFGRRAERAGLRPDDVIVGIDGHRVRSPAQAFVLLRSATEAAATFTVWREGRYQTVVATLGQREFGVVPTTYRPAPATP